MSHFKKFFLTVMVGALALFFEFILGKGHWAFILVVVVGGVMAFTMLIEMIKTLRSGRYGVDILAITAIIATLAVGEYWASLMILIMLTGGDSLEDYASRQAGRELQSLLDNSPQIAHRKEGDRLEDLTLDKVKVGDILVVKPHEIVPVDGQALQAGSVDESSLTGESRPVDKVIGDEIMSGSVNGEGTIVYKVTSLAEDSQYQQIVKLVKESQEKPAHFVRMADRYAVPFTAVAYLIGGIAWFVTKDPVRFAEVLVVASPCPLILAAPVALVAGMSRSSRNGIVVKTGTTIEKLAEAKTIAFDKTGTITKGQLMVAEINPVAGFSEDKFLSYLASAEQESLHILARSLVSYAQKRVNLVPVDNLEEVVGFGVKGEIDGQIIKIGRASFAHADTQPGDATMIFASLDDKYIGSVTFTDEIRPEAKNTIMQLRTLGVDNEIMLTGDRKGVAELTAEKVGIQTVHAECLPQDKINVLKNIAKNERPLIMVGDGINDAPALAIADVGIAMGAHGSSAASESADAVILKDDLSRVAVAVKVAQDTMKIARQSVLIGIFICVGLMLIASTGVIPALIGAMLQEVVDTVSILSALRAKSE
ncbi:cobalt ABC transporter ATP-binding protein [Enterococcus saigonensis]|uniref:Cd(2+)-exporting ATPase n=1 Tax=Enterococcus saigonensis TaxID=1805431 RepID=A0A679IHY0_9ENTE|nr:heavy metal translocating P-type ATPase [Enterococcus saigonensis]BCA85622.1 cobalt ABC transporter ATP-binding protein [Enterococcus saigonensis]